MLADDLADGGEPQATAGQPGGKKRFEDAFEIHLVYAPSSVADGNAHIVARHEVTISERFRSSDLPHLGFDLDATNLIHCLGSVVAKIEYHLLQLPKLTGYYCCIRNFADNQFDPRRQRGTK